MNCPKCGAYCDDSMSFCAECGTPLKQSVPNYAANDGFSQSGSFEQANQGGFSNQTSYNNQPNYNTYGGGGYAGGGYAGGPASAGGYGAPGGYKVPIKRRNIVVCIILSFITCGIYGIYWMIVMVNDLNLASGHTEDTSGGMVFLFTLITCGIYGLYWFYKAGEKVSEVQRRVSGYSDSNNGLLYLILELFGLGIVNYCLIQSELNKVALYTE